MLLALMLASSIVQVDGHAYRVEVRGEEVRVFQKAAITKRSLERRARMRKAVELATGCRIVDDYWQGTRIEGLLDCPKPPVSP